MRKLALILSIFSLHAFADSAGQSTTTSFHESNIQESTIHINPVIGVAEMNVQTKGSVDSRSGDGLTLGALGELGGVLAFQSGLLYNQFGAKTGVDEMNLNYLSVPLILKYNAISAEKSLYIRAGLMPGYLVSKNIKSAYESTNDVMIKSLDLPIILGFGGAIPVAPHIGLVISADWVHSLTNISDRAGYEAHNDGFLITTGASIAL